MFFNYAFHLLSTVIKEWTAMSKISIQRMKVGEKSLLSSLGRKKEIERGKEKNHTYVR